jgi:hypothetical protein
MGSSPVSEAPRGPLRRSENHALPPSRTTSRPWPPRLRLVAASAEELCFVGCRPARAPLLLAPVLLALSGLSWVAPTPADGLRVLVSLIALAATLALIALTRPRRVEVRVRPGDRQLLTPVGVEPLPERPRWRLIAEQPSTSPQPVYAAVLVEGERRWRLLEGPDPAQLLRELRSVLSYWPGLVEQEWGLPGGAQPWAFQPLAAPALEREAAAAARVLRGARAEDGLRLAMAVITGLVLLDLAVLLVSASPHVPSVHPLSLILPAVSASCLIAIALAVVTRQPRLVVGRDWVQESCVLGVRRVQQRIRGESVRGVHLVATGGGQGHLLVDGSEGPLSLLVRARDAERLREQLVLSLARLPRAEPETSGSIASVPRRWQSG